jgi:hypothetical protein
MKISLLVCVTGTEGFMQAGFGFDTWNSRVAFVAQMKSR